MFLQDNKVNQTLRWKQRRKTSCYVQNWTRVLPCAVWHLSGWAAKYVHAATCTGVPEPSHHCENDGSRLDSVQSVGREKLRCVQVMGCRSAASHAVHLHMWREKMPPTQWKQPARKGDTLRDSSYMIISKKVKLWRRPDDQWRQWPELNHGQEPVVSGFFWVSHLDTGAEPFSALSGHKQGAELEKIF